MIFLDKLSHNEIKLCIYREAGWYFFSQYKTQAIIEDLKFNIFFVLKIHQVYNYLMRGIFQNTVL